LLDNSSPHFPARRWFFQPSDKRFQFRNMLTNWLLANALSDSTRHMIQGTIQWYDSGARRLLPSAYCFSNQDIRLVLGMDQDIALRKHLSALPTGRIGSLWRKPQAPPDRMTTSPGKVYNSSSSLPGYRAVYSMRTFPHGTVCTRLALSFLQLQALLEEVCAQPLPFTGTRGQCTRMTSRIQHTSNADVLVIHKAPPAVSPQPPALPDPSALIVYSVALPPPPAVATDPASCCFLHLPGRPLTLADFPTSLTPPNPDISSCPATEGTPYQHRFVPQPFALPTDKTSIPPVGIWPSALARKWTSPEWHNELLRTHPGPLPHGLQPLQSASGPFSIISAILGTFNHGPDTVLTVWKRAEAYLQFAFHRADWHPAHRLGLHSIHTNLDAYRDSRSLS